jgi:hypothetical protein
VAYALVSLSPFSQSITDSILIIQFERDRHILSLNQSHNGLLMYVFKPLGHHFATALNYTGNRWSFYNWKNIKGLLTTFEIGSEEIKNLLVPNTDANQVNSLRLEACLKIVKS